MINDAEYLAMTFHCYYEELAPRFGYQTRPEPAKPWAEVSDQNKQLMIAVAEKLLNGHVQIIKKESEQVTISEPPVTAPDLKGIAMNIVNAILEEAGTDVATRQRINDDCDGFVVKVLEPLCPQNDGLGL